MNPEYLHRLPADIQRIVNSIEASLEAEIEVVVDGSGRRTAGRLREPLRCEVHEGAKIIIPAVDVFPDGAVLHELLHIRRFLVERVPRLEVCDEYVDGDIIQLDSAVHDLDNNLEHLVIVPEELRLRPDRRIWWEEALGREVMNLRQQPGLPDQDRKNSVYYLCAAASILLREGGIVEQARSLAAEHDFLDEVEAVTRSLVDAHGDKRAMVEIWVNAIGLPENLICLEE